MAHSYTHLLSHAIFSTKDRAAHIDAELKKQLHPYLGGIIRELGGNPVCINGTKNHVHLLVLLPGSVGVGEAMRVVKTNSSRWIHETWAARKDFAWQTGYAAFSVSRSNADQVRRYIDSQEEHHRTTTFEEELIAFFKRHGVEYDETYIWQ
jgi:putative transposase